MINLEFNGPLFIIGMPRSGTKLLRSLLNRHSRVSIPENETEFLPYLYYLVNRIGGLNDYGCFIKFYRQITKVSYFMNQLKNKKIIDPVYWYDSCNKYSSDELFKILIYYHLDKHLDEKFIWGDKSPSYINNITLINQIYPCARFIHIVRDVRDYCLSGYKTWGKNVYRSAYRWDKSIMKFDEESRPISNRVLEVKYENLIVNVCAELKKICSFLDIKYEKGMDSLNSPSENYGDARGLNFVKKDNKNKFYSSFSKKKIKRIEEVAFFSMKKRGYKIKYAGTEKKVSRMNLYSYALMDCLNLIHFYIKDKGLVPFLLSLRSHLLTVFNRKRLSG